MISGAGAVNALKDLNCKRLFLVTDPFFAKNGTAARIAKLTGAMDVEIFDKVRPDPTVELAAEGTARLRAFGADLLVALGGGSAMDCAKAMAYFAKGDYRLAAIPTTSGSGSEAYTLSSYSFEEYSMGAIPDSTPPNIAHSGHSEVREGS